jgi:acetate kinase
LRPLVVNAGSTSLKLSITQASGDTRELVSLDDALTHTTEFDCVLHRVVHGGARDQPALVDDDLVAELRALAELAPLHQPPAIELIEQCRRRFPDHRQYAVFDTSFHTSIPAAASTYALPERWRRRIRSYGFHGISHAWSTRCLADAAPGARRVVVAHLGGGASLCAVRDGRSVMTTMGFTPLDGLVMATRSGTLDPGAVAWLARHSNEDVLQVLEHESGLFGLCGDADMRVVLRRCNDGDDDAVLALDVYLHRLVTSIGACVADLGGVDALAFTGGVGEGAMEVRDLACQRLEWLGTRIRPTAVHLDSRDVVELTDPGAPVRTFVVHAREDLEMLHQVDALDADT